MRYKAFLLGLSSVITQVLMLRELLASYGGSELYIGTALFGWMMAIALGAYIGGRRNPAFSATVLFITTAIMVPLILLAIRFSPFIFNGIVGETIPFTRVAPLSVALMLLPGLMFGCLFTVINREGYRPSEAIIHTYLYEGFGAFIGGLLIILAVGPLFSNLSFALIISLLIIIAQFPLHNNSVKIVSVAFFIAAATVLALMTETMETYIDSHKYSGYDILASFDTHYGRQSILHKDDAVILVTDNAVETILPDHEAAEYDLVPPLLYRPHSTDLLYIGRAEFGAAQFSHEFPDLTIHALDPRHSLDKRLKNLIPMETAFPRITADPVSFMHNATQAGRYDVIVLKAPDPTTFAAAALFGSEFFLSARNVLKPGGILYIPTSYDTDRYILPEKQNVLSMIHAGLKASFKHVAVWPGHTTLFFASDDSVLNIAPSKIIIRLDSLSYCPTYIDSYFLENRFDEFKISRLEEALTPGPEPHSVERPILPIYQAIFKSRAHGFDDRLVPLLINNPYPAIVAGIIILGIFIVTILNRRRGRIYGLFLYFMAGFVSLLLELVVFYIYQAHCGSLYSHMGVLIGVFMLGLAAGTYYADRIDSRNIELPALLMLLTAAVIYMTTWHKIDYRIFLVYNALFIGTAALATGTIFVGATRRFYFGRSGANRGAGYALEILGSGLAALTALNLLLPLLGLGWLLGTVLILIVISLAGAIFSQ
jgi:spermidine synthase